MHTLSFDSETGTDAMFRCTSCGQIIGFKKPGIGEPAAVPLEGGGWTHPDNFDQWMVLCEPT